MTIDMHFIQLHRFTSFPLDVHVSFHVKDASLPTASGVVVKLIGIHYIQVLTTLLCRRRQRSDFSSTSLIEGKNLNYVTPLSPEEIHYVLGISNFIGDSLHYSLTFISHFPDWYNGHSSVRLYLFVLHNCST